MKDYIVTFDIKRHRQEFHREFIVIAGTAKEARQKFDEQWDRRFTDRGLKAPHPFHIKVRLLRAEA